MFRAPQLVALSVVFQLHLVTAAASDPRGSTVGKDFGKLGVQTGLSLLEFASAALIFQQCVVSEGLGGKGSYRRLSFAVMLMSAILNFAYKCGYEGCREKHGQ